MKNSDLVLQNRFKILPELINWVETFNPEEIIYNKNRIEETEQDEIYKSGEIMLNLVKRLENNECSEKDFEDILFHLEQINFDEPKIIL